MEQNSRDGNMGTKEVKRYDTPVCIHLHSLRHRLCDSDGISGKAAIDGLVIAGILQDDSPKEVPESPIQTQVKIPMSQKEETIITIEGI